MVCRAFKSWPPIKMEQNFLIVLKDFFEGAPKEVINVSLHSKTFLADCFSPVVANAKFSLLKLLIYEPYYLCLSRLECLRPRLEPS